MAYVATVSLQHPTIRKLGKLGVMAGTITLSTYDTTRVPIAEVLSRFRGTPVVTLSGISSLGFLTAWEAGSVKAWYPTQQTAGAGNRIGVEATNGDNIGTVSFIAIGVAP